MSQIRDFRTKTNELVWIVPADLPNAGDLGGHGGTGSTRFHNELGNAIDASRNVSDFRERLDRLAARWEINPALMPDWPEPR